MITVMCPDKSDGTGRTFEVRRSSLSRSPTFAKFFKSSHYLEDCDMQITFISDPAGCFEIVQSYLDEGPDAFSKTRLRVFVTMNYRIVDRFVLLVRLHLLAKKLALPVLMDMAYDVILQTERLMTPSFCITLARVVFSKNVRFDNVLKDWVLKHIGYHFLALKDIEVWKDILKGHESELNGRWSKLVEANLAVLAAIEQEEVDKELLKLISDFPTEAQRTALSTIEGLEVSVEEFIRNLREEDARQPRVNRQDGVDDSIDEDQATKDTKAREMLGMSPTACKKPGKKEIGLGRSQSMPSNTAKARAVMGIDGSFGRVDSRKLAKPDRFKPDRSSKLFSLLK